MGGMDGFLVGCFPWATACLPAAPGSCRSDLRDDVAAVPKNSVTGHVRVKLMCTSSSNAATVARNVERGSGSPSSHLSHLTKNWWESWWTFHRRLIMRTGVILFSRSLSWESSASRSLNTHCMWGHPSPNMILRRQT